MSSPRLTNRSRIRSAFGDGEHGLDDAVVAGAAAEVAAQRDPHLVLARHRRPLEERRGGDQHARRAEAALDAALVEESALQRTQLARSRKPFDGHDLTPLRL